MSFNRFKRSGPGVFMRNRRLSADFNELRPSGRPGAILALSTMAGVVADDWPSTVGLIARARIPDIAIVPAVELMSVPFSGIRSRADERLGLST